MLIAVRLINRLKALDNITWGNALGLAETTWILQAESLR